jgi:hypothetical protein
MLKTKNRMVALTIAYEYIDSILSTLKKSLADISIHYEVV